MAYCDAADLHANGLPRGSLPNAGRLAASVSTSANTIELDGHGFATGDTITFRPESGGALPAPLVEGVDYYAIEVNESHFRVTDAPAGAALDLTSAGSRVVVIAPLPIASALAWASRILDDMLPAHVVPLTAPYHEIVRITCAELAIWKLSQFTGAGSKSLTELVDFAQKRLARWGKGVPIRGVNAPPPANLAASASASPLDARGWTRFGGIS